MTRIIEQKDHLGLRHYWIRGSTLTGWRPQRGEVARLVEALASTRVCPDCKGSLDANGMHDACWICGGFGEVTNTDSQQALVNDIVTVERCNTGPGYEQQGVHLTHDGGSNHRCATLDTPRGEPLNHGTFGHWEHLVPIELECNDVPLARITSEDRVGVLVAAVRELSDDEQRAFMARMSEE